MQIDPFDVETVAQRRKEPGREESRREGKGGQDGLVFNQQCVSNWF